MNSVRGKFERMHTMCLYLLYSFHSNLEWFISATIAFRRGVTQEELKLVSQLAFMLVFELKV